MPAWKTAFLALLLQFTGFALAEEKKTKLTPEQLQKLHGKIDADEDGKVSLSEAIKFSHNNRKTAALKEGQAIMQNMDGDKDGKVSLDELLKGMYGEEPPASNEEQKKELEFHKTRDGEQFEAADVDGDGLLDTDELSSFFYPELQESVLQIVVQRSLEEKDEDKDGLLTFDEFMAEKRRADDEQLPPGIAPEGDRDLKAPTSDEQDRRIFNKLDKDRSGQLDGEELLAWESARLHTADQMEMLMMSADTDKDFHVSVDELRKTYKNKEVRQGWDEMAQHHEL